MKGFVANSEAIDLIAQSKALILPTRWYEGFPVTIAEAYSVGTPVIASNIGNAGSLVEDDKTGLKFKYESAEDLSAKIKTLSSTSLDREAIRKYYADKYSRQKNYEELKEIYDTVTGKAGSHR
jgi:glycosyltransferase involved in cell wall biosynthesis